MKPFVKLDSLDLAKYILATLGDMSHLKLQKLLYYVEAWHLAVHDQSIISDDFKAWVHGPVCLRVWHHFKNTAILTGDVGIPAAERRSVKKLVEDKLSSDQFELVSDVLKEYGDKTAYHLECLTHQETPWREARKGVPAADPCSSTISRKSMKDYYSQALAKV